LIGAARSVYQRRSDGATDGVIVDDAHWPMSHQPSLTFLAPLETEPLLCWPAETVTKCVRQCRAVRAPAIRLGRESGGGPLDRHGSGLSPGANSRSQEAPEIRWHWPIAASAAAHGVEAVLSTESPLPLTARLEQAFAARLTKLHATTRTLILLAALDEGALVELDQAARILIGTAVSLDDWTEAVSAGLGVVSVDGFRFRHPLIRSAVYRDAGSEEEGHAALADALADDPDRAVWHRAAATTEPDGQ
jgi:hypothetical protein